MRYHDSECTGHSLEVKWSRDIISCQPLGANQDTEYFGTSIESATEDGKPFFLTMIDKALIIDEINSIYF